MTCISLRTPLSSPSRPSYANEERVAALASTPLLSLRYPFARSYHTTTNTMAISCSRQVLGDKFGAANFNNFRSWYADNLKFDFNRSDLPWNIKIWPKTSWKRYFMAFLARQPILLLPSRFVDTNFSDAGTHQRSNTRYQVQLQNRMVAYRFPEFGASDAVYDVFYERLPNAFSEVIPLPQIKN